jgi:hypothetical protein
MKKERSRYNEKKSDMRVRKEKRDIMWQRPVAGCLGVREHEAGKESWSEEEKSWRLPWLVS